MQTVYEPTDEDRERLEEPLGEVIKDKGEIEKKLSNIEGELVLVGDYVSLNFEKLNPNISIVDGKAERKKIEPNRLEEIEGFCLKTENPAGRISEDAWNSVKESLVREEKVKLRVDGEEDLLGIPAMSLAPHGSMVVYGLRNEGSVLVEVNKKTREMMRSFMDRRDFGKVVVGGSWEYLHAGHKYLLLTAFDRGKKVSIGITSDEMMRSKIGGHENYKKYSERLSDMKGFLEKFGLFNRANIRKIKNFKGTALEEGDAIAVSEETYDNAVRINELRREAGKDPLNIIKVPILKNRKGKPFSSSRRRS